MAIQDSDLFLVNRTGYPQFSPQIGPITGKGLTTGVDYAQYVKIWNMNADTEYTGPLYQNGNQDINAVFDGNESTTWLVISEPTLTNLEFRFYPPTPIKVNGLIEIKGGVHTGDTAQLYINDDLIIEEVASDVDPKWLSGSYSGEINYIRFTQRGDVSQSKRFSVNAFKIDGEYLISNRQATYLEFGSNTDFDKFHLFDPVKECDASGNLLDGIGTVGEVVPAQNRIILTKEQPNWDIGSYVQGPPTDDTSSGPSAQYSYQVRADELKAKMADTDLMLVNRESGGNYASYKGTKSQVLDGGLVATDHLLVNRGAASYYCTGAEFEEYFGAGSALALMHGLRFDSGRITYLERNSSTASSGDFTYSFWAKRLSGPVDCCALATDLSGGNKSSIQLLRSGKFSCYGQDNVAVQIEVDNPVPVNQWGHFVVSVENNIATMYINGENKGSGNVSGNSFVSGDGQTIGKNYNKGGNETDAYFSDCYLVDGQALDPTKFGANYDGVWGPLDSTDVKANIGSFGANGFFLPFDPEAPSLNGQIWSSFAVNNGIEPWTKAFDGVTNPQYNTNEATSLTDFTPVVWEYTGSTPLTFNKLRIYARRDIGDIEPIDVYEAQILINDFDVSDQVADEHAWYEIDMTGASNSSSLEKITLIGYMGLKQGNMRLAAVEIDGLMLIDGVSFSAIGHDESGNGNHFRDENFVLTGNTQDTVLDTPLKDYAVLESGTNGNLVGSGALTYTGEAGKTYYYETDGVAQTNTAPVPPLPNGTHNFGQQPFADVGPQGDEETLYQNLN